MNNLLNPPDIFARVLTRAGSIPNNERCALLAYRQAVKLPASDPASAFEALFERNGWGGSWRNGVFAYHHFHSNAHEVLGVFSGSATIQLGGPDGVAVEVCAGDVVIIPAGVGHKRLEASGGFGVVGAYPAGQQPDLCRDEGLDGHVAVGEVPVPACDPIYGADGPLRAHWAPGP